MFRFFIVALVACCCSSSFAGWQAQSWVENRTSYCFADLADACSFGLPLPPDNQNNIQSCTPATGNQCSCVRYNGGMTGPVLPTCNEQCPVGQERFNGQCVAVCSGGTVRNPSNGACDCPAGTEMEGGSCVPIPCPAGQVRDGSSGECVWISSCPSGQTLFRTTGPGGAITSASCVPTIERPETEPCITYAQMQSPACQREAEECSATGGTFGVVNDVNVCFPPGDNPPPCASGASQFVTNPDGSSSPSCVGSPNIGNGNIADAPVSSGTNTAATSTAQSAADTANNTAAIARINNDGFQAVVNAVNNLTGKTSGGAGAGSGSTAEQDQSNTGAIVQAINEFKSQEHGAGKCDPKNDDYAKCTGMTEEGVDENSLIDAATNAGVASLDSARDELLQSIENRPEIEMPNELIDLMVDILPQPVSCSNMSITWRGFAMQIRCEDTEVMRLWFAWLFALLTAWHCYQVALSPRG